MAFNLKPAHPKTGNLNAEVSELMIAAGVQVLGYSNSTFSVNSDLVQATIFEPNLTSEQLGVAIDWDIYKAPALLNGGVISGGLHNMFTDIGGAIGISTPEDHLFQGRMKISEMRVLASVRFKF